MLINRRYQLTLVILPLTLYSTLIAALSEHADEHQNADDEQESQ